MAPNFRLFWGKVCSFPVHDITWYKQRLYLRGCCNSKEYGWLAFPHTFREGKDQIPAPAL